ncbi:aldo/keto reductase family protein [Burkholderia ambifaria AMMD]|jgi:aryl-alcohol dehydrogenase-like predicted oxidoreductase|uniref:Aldo/keto reductase n=1 Tax=Burkholderia ambifaria (strain ATCC BAA-244 / DSM 16087 / CCUG 44356 / LMG 19182 / AMMD) TaxID=339670 RepID=Q0B6Z5_BURCM|nr:aldo/keto reductase [Burkholderia ambifaria]ABI90078.1 aldo/keto reductase [Burkholderia ambifaria AMMD]AJY25067.1 aldo/keto reductase family protein [Burkholderia ambifaria AMMD]MBR7930617.1 aldo/keto reductase [Burkholderia ambifaria]PEH68154.1 aldo/keto reductase [Burkholderia ambifaria]QQC07292.1 aldo/keto reductase [Burkholderia ambifaria]
MDYRYLGRSALKVSPLCLGTMMFGGETDEATSTRIIDKAFDQGVNFIDTADVYHAGRSEEIVGRAIARHRNSWVVATKFGYPAAPDAGPNRQGQSRKWIYESVDASLKRLGTEYIDILYFHRTLTDAPLEEGMRAVADLIRQGKVRYVGLSNFKGWRIAEIVRIADQLGIDRPVASEPLYNLVDRTAEVEQLPAAAHYGIGVVPYSPLARGVLTGKYAPDAPPPADSRAGRGDRRIQQTEWRPESLHIAQQVAAHAAARGTTSVAFALAWVMKNRIVSSTIAGPRTDAHWDSYIDALTLELGPDDERFVDSLVPPGHASTHGYTDPGYPVEGRKV